MFTEPQFHYHSCLCGLKEDTTQSSAVRKKWITLAKLEHTQYCSSPASALLISPWSNTDGKWRFIIIEMTFQYQVFIDSWWHLSRHSSILSTSDRVSMDIFSLLRLFLAPSILLKPTTHLISAECVFFAQIGDQNFQSKCSTGHSKLHNVDLSIAGIWSCYTKLSSSGKDSL